MLTGRKTTEPEELKPARVPKQEQHPSDEASEEGEPPRRFRVDQVGAGAVGAGVRFQTIRLDNGRDQESRALRECRRATPEQAEKKSMDDYHARKRLARVRPPNNGHGMVEVDRKLYPYLLDQGCTHSCLPAYAAGCGRGEGT